MGINAGAIKVFLREMERTKEPNGRILTLGRQDVLVTAKELDVIFAKYDRKVLVEPEIPVISSKPEFSDGDLISDQYLFSALGFKELRSLDASIYEKADYIFDLNEPVTPEAQCNSWDVIFDGGTIEHVFHIPNGLANIFRMLKVGGRIIHIAPSSNHLDHGFYMFSPTLFWDYYNANNYEVNVCEVFCYRSENLYGEGGWEVSDYVPGGLSRISLGGLDDGIYGVIMIATKTTESTCDIIPQQGLYANKLWKNSGLDQTMVSHNPRFKGKGLGLRIKTHL